MSTSHIVNCSSGARMASAIPSHGEWEWIRPTFERMYIEERATLSEVMAELHKKHDFKATKQMYKRRIKEWGLVKNLKKHEVEHILGIGVQREAQGKTTDFILRGRKVDMRSVRSFQRRQKLRTSDAVAAYVTGRSGECRHLRAITPERFDSSSWATPDRGFENALRAFANLFHGLVDCSYYWIESGEIVMPPSALRGEVSDICSSLVEQRTAETLNMIIVRKLALLLESIVRSDDAWIHCRLVYTLWVISTAGYPMVTQTLLRHLNGLVSTYTDQIQTRAQYPFVRYYSSLETSRAAKLAADMISLKAEMVGGLRVDNNAAAFRLRSLDYDVFWRRREQGNAGDIAGAFDLLERCHLLLGPLAVETLTVLRAILQDGVPDHRNSTTFDSLLEYLQDSSKLKFCESLPAFTFDGRLLGMEATSELACIYCQIGVHDAEAWIFSRLLVHQKQTASGLRREYSLLLHISRCEALARDEQGQAWLERKQEIEDLWQAEVAAATPGEG